MSKTMDTFIAKTKGAAHGVRARIDGLHGVFATLAKQHGEAGAMLDQVVADPTKRQVMWPTIRTTLLSHERAELQELIPVLRSLPETRAFAESHDADAKQLEQMIDRLDALPIKSTEWGELFEQLTTTVKTHALQFEEKQVFPVAQDALGETRSNEIDEKLTAAFEKQMKQA